MEDKKLRLDLKSLRSHLRRNKVTAVALRKALGVAESRLGNWMYSKGEKPVPWEFAVGMAAALACKVDELGEVFNPAEQPHNRPGRPRTSTEQVDRLRANMAAG